MAKYDDFGRPIYETAEEYNKAHKGGVCPRTYDSPVGANYQTNTRKETHRHQSAAQRYTNQTGAKKAKSIVIAFAAFFLVLNMVIIIFIFHSVGAPFEEYIEVNGDEWLVTTDDEGYGEYIGDDITPLPEGFETFSYNGQIYTLPTNYQEISQMGFTLEEEYDEDFLLPTEYEEMLVLNGEEGYMSAMIRVSNYTDEEVPLGKCTVDYFFIDNPAAFDDTEAAPDFVFGEGLTFESSYEEMEAYFGTPYYHYEEHSEEGCFFDSYEWAYYGEDEIHFVSVTLWNDVIQDVRIEKKAFEGKEF